MSDFEFPPETVGLLGTFEILISIYLNLGHTNSYFEYFLVGF